MKNGIYRIHNLFIVHMNKQQSLYTQRTALIKTTKRVLLSTFWLLQAKVLVEVKKRFCCVEKKYC